MLANGELKAGDKEEGPHMPMGEWTTPTRSKQEKVLMEQQMVSTRGSGQKSALHIETVLPRST